MMGDALLIRPIRSGNDGLQTYLPAGRWRQLLKKAASLAGRQHTTYRLQSLRDFPVFVKEGEIFIMGTATDSADIGAYVYLERLSSSSEYVLHNKDGTVMMKLKAEKRGADIVFTDSATGRKAAGAVDEHGFWFVKISDLAPTNTPTATPASTPTPTPTPTTFPTAAASPPPSPPPATASRARLPLLFDGQPVAAR